MSVSVLAASLPSRDEPMPPYGGEGERCEIGGSRTCWMRYQHTASPVVSRNEQISLRALIVFVAQTMKRNEFAVERDLADYFCVPNIQFLPQHHFNNAVHFLVDQVPESPLLD